MASINFSKYDRSDLIARITIGDDTFEGLSIQKIKIIRGTNNSDSFKIGTSLSALAEFKIFDESQSFDTKSFAGSIAKIEIGAKNGLDVEWVVLGQYILETPKKNADNSWSFTGYDVLQKARKAFNPESLVYPLTVYDIVKEACTQAGIDFNTVSWGNSTQVIYKPIQFYEASCKEVIEAAAELGLAVALINPGTNKLEIKEYSSESNLIDGDIIYSFKKEEEETRKGFDHLIIKQTGTTDHSEGAGTAPYIIEDNLFIQGDAARFATDISNKLPGLTANKGVVLTWKGDPTLSDTGIFTFTYLGKSYTIIPQVRTFTFDGGLTEVMECKPASYKPDESREKKLVRNIYKTKAQLEVLDTEIQAKISSGVDGRLVELKLTESGITERVQGEVETYVTTNKEALKGADGSNFTWNIVKNGAILDKSKWVKYDAQVLKIDGETINFNTAAGNSSVLGYYNLNEYAKELIVGETYTVSFDAKNLRDNAQIKFGLGGFSGHSDVTLEPLEEKHCVLIGVREDVSFAQVLAKGQTTGYMTLFEMSNLKIEKGSVKNPVFIPHPDDIKGKDGKDGIDGKSGVSFSNGKMLFTDPTFVKGMNSIGKYTNDINNAPNLTLTLTSDSSSPFNNEGDRVVKISTSSIQRPNYGGFLQFTQSRPNAIFVHRIVAKIPVGWKINFHQNQTGDNKNILWLTDVLGTGKYEEYVYRHSCGDTGTFSTLGLVSISKASSSTIEPTSTSPLVWYVAYATMYDMTGLSLDQQFNELQVQYSTYAEKTDRAISNKVEVTAYTAQRDSLYKNIGEVTVSAEGLVTNVKIKGDVIKLEGATTINNSFKVATDGTVTMAGFTVKSDTMYAGSGASYIRLSGSNGYHPILAGGTDYATATFAVSSSGQMKATDAVLSGAITAKSGSIGGFNIDSNRLSYGSGSTFFAIAPTDYNRIIVGGDSYTNALFVVRDTGELWAKNVKISGNITAESGTIGGFKINTDSLTYGSGSTFFGIFPGGYNRIIVGGDSYTNAPFVVRDDGQLWAKSVTLTGSITATSGSIGGFRIEHGVLQGSNGLRLTGRSDGYGIYTTNGRTYTTTSGYFSGSGGDYGGSHTGYGSFSSGSYSGTGYFSSGSLGGSDFSNSDGLNMRYAHVSYLSTSELNLGRGKIRGMYHSGAGGYMYAQLTGSGWVITNSDIRLKENISPLDHEYDEFIYNLPLIKYTYKADEKHKPQVGVNANYLMKILPEYMAKSFLHQDEVTGLYGANYELLVPYLIKTIQDLNERDIQAQTNIMKLQDDVDRLIGKLEKLVV